MRYKLNLNKKKSLFGVLFQYFCNFIIWGIFLYAAVAGVLCWFTDFDIFDNRYFLKSVIISLLIYLLIYITLIVIYIKASKDVVFDNEGLVIHFGYTDISKGSYAKIKRVIKYNDITDFEYIDEEIKKDFSYYINCKYPELDVFGGKYKEPYVAITIKDRRKLLLPVENAKEFYNELTQRLS